MLELCVFICGEADAKAQQLLTCMPYWSNCQPLSTRNGTCTIDLAETVMFFYLWRGISQGLLALNMHALFCLVTKPLAMPVCTSCLSPDENHLLCYLW